TEYQRVASAAQLTSSPPSPTHELSHLLPASAPVQKLSSKRHRLRTFFILFMLMLALLVALSAVLGPNLFAKIPGSASNSLPALGASGPFVKALLISTDEEGGPYVHRLSHIYGYRMSATDIYNTGNPQVATQQGIKASKELLALGINENLAPDVDVNLVNGYDMVTRTFGHTLQS